MWGALVKIVSQIRIVKNGNQNLVALLYRQERIKKKVICYVTYIKGTKVILNTHAKNVFLQMLNYLVADTTPAFRQFRTIVQSGEMDACKIVNESTDQAATDIDNTGVNERGEKRKSEETEQLDKHRGKKRRGERGKKLPPGERYVPPPQKRNPGVSFSQEHFQETSYYFQGGLRKVYPYYFDYKTYCKGRWIGKSLREVFSTEFRAEPLDYYERAVKQGRIRLNETPVQDLDITLKNNDFMRNTVHRHEPPVTARPLEILEDNGEVVVVDKPASLPVHPCGRFRHNTVIFILGKERGLCGLHTVHRLDRLTSGVLLFARTLEVSKRLDQLVRDRQLEKEYLCRVEGEFPERELVCEEPILVVSFKVGVCRVDPKGKPCRTVFQRLSWNGHSSVVRCLPLTGRTHQIRVHLQFLGHPILNDPIYGSSAWGPTRAKGGVVGMSDEQLLQALMDDHRSKESLHLLDLPEVGLVQGIGHNAGAGPTISASDQSGSAHCMEIESVNTLAVAEAKSQVLLICTDPEKNTGNDRNEVDPATTNLSACALSSRNAIFMQTGTNNSEKEVVDTKADSIQTPNQTQYQGFSSTAGFATPVRDPLCTECKIVRPDPTEKELVMYLHALRYKGPDFEYCTKIPEWAREDWEED